MKDNNHQTRVIDVIDDQGLIWLISENAKIMDGLTEILLRDREHAGELLSMKLRACKEDPNTVVVGIPHGGVCVAWVIAENLKLPLEVMPCRKIKHPTDKNKNIGSVSYSEACIHDCPFDVPQDYIYHQMALLRHAINYQQKIYYGDTEPISLQYKTVILVDDILKARDTMIACLREIRKQNPLKIVVAVPVVNVEAARTISEETDDFIFLRMRNELEGLDRYYSSFPGVNDEEVRVLLKRTTEKASCP
ncbi:hypothetical protein LVD17_20405 [Fulvivirga ulvae]|uniref:phosphoribosyltransferase family protein n=1 Tax=Fulvivirga ulvae TaxID=2904245 RepID=UPI001F3F62A2|nr:phosphoribosyltransferase family protein [Fulvivirga ulvae]UII30658.1 hypothetical protein LVD17_20405 [Fulvivirga ulvae]